MDELPELAFEQILSHLNLEDRLKSRAVSRGWRNRFDIYPVKILCYSERPRGFILEKGRWVSGKFAENFICCRRFVSFFDTIGQTILSNLRHLRLCSLKLNDNDRPEFARLLSSFNQLQELDLIRVGNRTDQRGSFVSRIEIELNLPMLESIQLKDAWAMSKLKLDAPRLKNVKVLDGNSYFRLDLVHPESVERLVLGSWSEIEERKLKNLKYLYSPFSTCPSGMKQLKELHVHHSPGASMHRKSNLEKLFQQKELYGLTELKVYLHGLFVIGPDDPAIDALTTFNREYFGLLAENPSRLANEIPCCKTLYYKAIEQAAPGTEISVIQRYTDLERVIVDRPIGDIERFRDLLKNCENIIEFYFYREHAQPRDLFDRLPEHCAIQKLVITRRVPSCRFLYPMKNLIQLRLHCSIDIQTVRKLFNELPYLYYFEFKIKRKLFEIKIDRLKRFKIKVDESWPKGDVADLDAAIQFVNENTPQPKRKAEVLSD